MILLLWIIVFLATLTLYLREVYSRFSKYGVKGIKPVPFLGNVAEIAFQKCHMAENVQMLYQAFPKERFTGRFELLRPIVVINDLELIKRVTIKDAEYFFDHRKMTDETIDTLFGRSLFALNGQEWKDMRATLSPAFTSSKIRAMTHFMVDVNNQMIKVLMEKIEASKSGYIDIDCKDLTTRCANDVIASCAFGVKVDSHKETENEFYQHGKSTAHFGLRRMLVYYGYSSFPWLMKALNIKMFGGKSSLYFKELFLKTMSERESKNIVRPDLLHLLLEAKKGKLKHDEKDKAQDIGFATVEESDLGKRVVERSWSDSDLVAQAVLFFSAGFKTISLAMCFLLHEMAINVEMQERLQNEIDDYDAKNNGVIDYNSLRNLKYLDMVISEVLRLWSIGIGIDRVCVKNYNLGKPNDESTTDFIIRKGELILVPLWCIHRDPKYFADPDKFDPERFSEQNKVNIKPFTYMPFGTGPRNCIGSRFALCEMKVMTYLLLRQFRVTPCEKSTIPIKLSPSSLLLEIKGGHWIRFSKRKSEN